MKRSIICILAVLLISLTSFRTYAADTGSKQYFIDNASLLSQGEAEELDEMLIKLSDRLGMDVVILTVNSTNGYSTTDYADDYFDYNGYGRGEDDDGLLLLIDMGSRSYYISTSGYAIYALNDDGIALAGSVVTDKLSEGDYYGAFSDFADLTENLVERAKQGNPYTGKQDMPRSFNFKFIIYGLVIGLIAAFTTTGYQKGKLKSVKYKENANAYFEQDSLNITGQYDNFINFFVTRVPIQRASGGGSSTHTSSSGHTHGGGGGHF